MQANLAQAAANKAVATTHRQSSGTSGNSLPGYPGFPINPDAAMSQVPTSQQRPAGRSGLHHKEAENEHFAGLLAAYSLDGAAPSPLPQTAAMATPASVQGSQPADLLTSLCAGRTATCQAPSRAHHIDSANPHTSMQAVYAPQSGKPSIQSITQSRTHSPISALHAAPLLKTETRASPSSTSAAPPAPSRRTAGEHARAAPPPQRQGQIPAHIKRLLESAHAPTKEAAFSAECIEPEYSPQNRHDHGSQPIALPAVAAAALTSNDPYGSQSAKTMHTGTIAISDPQWPTMLGRQLVNMAGSTGQGQQTAELRLDPPELGPLRVTLSMSDNIAHAAFFCSHATVRYAVENALPQLHQLLMQAGISLGQANVSDQPHTSHAFGQAASLSGRQDHSDLDDPTIKGDPSPSPLRTRPANHRIDTYA